MQTIRLKVTAKDIENYEKFQAEISDYPAYMSTSGLTRADMVILAKVLSQQYHDAEYDITIKVKPIVKGVTHEGVETKQEAKTKH